MNSKSLIKVLLSVVMVLMVLWSVNLDDLRTAFLSMSPIAAILVIVGYTVGQLMSSVKWWTIARAGGITTPYPTALKVYFIGMFVNCFSVGMVGGDAVRGVLVAQGQPKKTEGIASVVADRIHGLTVLSCLALFTSFTIGNDRVPHNLILLLLLMVVGFIGAWLVGPWILVNFPFLKNTRLSTKLQQVAAIFPRDPKTLLIITAISLVFHTLQISLHAVMAAGMGISIPLATLFVVIPFVNIASSLPISWQGLGVRENSYIFFLTAAPAIVSKEQAVAFGALWLLAVTVSSAIGGIVALMTGDLRAIKLARAKEASPPQTSEVTP